MVGLLWTSLLRTSLIFSSLKKKIKQTDSNAKISKQYTSLFNLDKAKKTFNLDLKLLLPLNNKDIIYFQLPTYILLLFPYYKLTFNHFTDMSAEDTTDLTSGFKLWRDWNLKLHYVWHFSIPLILNNWCVLIIHLLFGWSAS